MLLKAATNLYTLIFTKRFYTFFSCSFSISSEHILFYFFKHFTFVKFLLCYPFQSREICVVFKLRQQWRKHKRQRELDSSHILLWLSGGILLFADFCKYYHCGSGSSLVSCFFQMDFYLLVFNIFSVYAQMTALIYLHL